MAGPACTPGNGPRRRDRLYGWASTGNAERSAVRPMVVVIDTLESHGDRPRHPEKAHRPDAPILRKPEWIRVKAPGSPVYRETTDIVRQHGLVTVCEEAGCPN